MTNPFVMTNPKPKSKPNPQIHPEIPLFGPRFAPAVVAAGARRLELNAAGSYAAGGLTPSLDELAALRASLPSHVKYPVPVRVMIRPRGAPLKFAGGLNEGGHGKGRGRDFVYSPTELDEMEAAIHKFAASGLLEEGGEDGFVFGVLEAGHDDDVRIDFAACRRLVAAAGPSYKCVFHRAFDEVVGDGGNGEGSGWKAALDGLVACGFDGILTSGGPGSASQHVGMLGEIVVAAGDRVEIVIGGGVRSDNVIVDELGFVGKGFLDKGEREGLCDRGKMPWVHSSCLSRGAGGAGGEEEVDVGEVAGILRRIRVLTEHEEEDINVQA